MTPRTASNYFKDYCKDAQREPPRCSPTLQTYDRRGDAKSFQGPLPAVQVLPPAQRIILVDHWSL